ncbi:hypothetical protein SARC_09966 [Sphaeroforma arctica JP610]|uniref:Uncharacterized protein n=1 Tax=Sphaeroforma arctica JP610 TaxID=667725 RepID=A0A0L0FNM7_9EUKA|nr:hypothetical protein SARC_09966 [Sphaeroforma arctica JP610]KNC77573.1 hypothetical protein SARC_09966 [Sphaeroforma arctica JP610]|eukprot:XP_014151475.1 hypothetical protein SARC_09966 [Sphaeroforma arctica JP610]
MPDWAYGNSPIWTDPAFSDLFLGSVLKNPAGTYGFRANAFTPAINLVWAALKDLYRHPPRELSPNDVGIVGETVDQLAGAKAYSQLAKHHNSNSDSSLYSAITDIHVRILVWREAVVADIKGLWLSC